MSPESLDLLPRSIEEYAKRIRSGESTIEKTTEIYLERISRLDDKYQAYSYVDADRALQTASGLDVLLRSGVDLGPLMGVPVAVKDSFSVDGMPSTIGSNLDLGPLVPPPGPFIQRLQRSGAVVLGKVRMIEFAAGTQNLTHVTPWNPCDPNVRRSPGGSSNGSAVAVGAQLSLLGIGSDTGGSVRLPAAFCGLAGFKPTHGTFPLDGIFPLSEVLDTVGLLCQTAGDTRIAFEALHGTPVPIRRDIAGVRLGVYDQASAALQVDDDVMECYLAALARLREAGALLVTIPALPEAIVKDVDAIFADLVATDLMSTLTVDRYQKEGDKLDPVVRERLEKSLTVTAVRYSQLERRRQALSHLSDLQFEGLDAIVQPTSPMTPKPVETYTTVEQIAQLNRYALRNTRIGNVYSCCALSLPIQHLAGALPVGLEVRCRAGADAELLSLAQAMPPYLA